MISNRLKFFSLILFFCFVFSGALCAQTSSEEVSSGSQTVSSEDFSELFNSIDDSSAPAAQSRNSAISGIWIFIRMIIVLAIVVAAVYFIFKLMKKSVEIPASDDPFVRKLSSVVLAPGKSVQIVSLVDKAYILGVSDNNVSLIKEIDDKELINAMNLYYDRKESVSKPKNFSELLETFFPGVKKQDSDYQGESSSAVYNEDTASIIESLKNKRLGGDENEEQ